MTYNVKHDASHKIVSRSTLWCRGWTRSPRLWRQFELVVVEREHPWQDGQVGRHRLSCWDLKNSTHFKKKILKNYSLKHRQNIYNVVYDCKIKKRIGTIKVWRMEGVKFASLKVRLNIWQQITFFKFEFSMFTRQYKLNMRSIPAKLKSILGVVFRTCNCKNTIKCNF